MTRIYRQVGSITTLVTPSALPRIIDAKCTQVAATRVPGFSPVRIADVWNDALVTYGAHSGALLLCAFVGFATPTIVSYWIGTQAVLSNYAWVGPVVTLSEKPPLLSAIILAIAALVGSSFARGMITWITLHHPASGANGTAQHGSFSQAIRMTIAHYPSVLFGTLFYSAFMTTCILGMSLLLRSLKFDQVIVKSAAGWSEPSRALRNTGQQLLERSVTVLLPDLDAPFAELVPEMGAELFRQFALTPTYKKWMREYKFQIAWAYLPRFELQSEHPKEWHLITAASLVLLLVAEILLRFRTVMAFAPSRSLQFCEAKHDEKKSCRSGSLAPLIASARFGLRHLGVATLHIGVVQFGIFVLCFGLVEFPLAVMNNFILPNASQYVGGLPLLPLMKFVQMSAASVVSAIALSFSVVHDAQLYEALRSSRSSVPGAVPVPAY